MYSNTVHRIMYSNTVHRIMYSNTVHRIMYSNTAHRITHNCCSALFRKKARYKHGGHAKTFFGLRFDGDN